MNKSDQRLYDEYHDLLSDDADANLIRLIRNLDAVTQPTQPPQFVMTSLDEALRLRASERALQSVPGRTAALARWLPRSHSAIRHGGEAPSLPETRPKWKLHLRTRSERPRFPLLGVLNRALNAAGLAVVVVTVAFIVGMLTTTLPRMQSAQAPAPAPAAPPTRTAPPLSPQLSAALDRTFQSSPYSREVMKKGLGKRFSVAQTIDGFTVTIARAYADSRYIFVGFVVTGPKGHSFVDIKLEDLNSRVSRPPGSLRVLGVSNTELERGPSSDTSDGRDKAYFLGFKAPKLEAGTRELKLRLEIPVITAREVLGGRASNNMAYPDPCNERSYPWRCYIVHGPFAFDLTVPVESSTPQYYDPQVQGMFAEMIVKFLDERLSYVHTKGQAVARLHDQRARLLLTLAYSSEVRDLAALDIPNTKLAASNEDPRRAVWETDSLSSTRASMPVRWEAGGQPVIRRFQFERVGGSWKISGIESIEQAP